MVKWKMVRLGDVCENASSNIAQKDLAGNDGIYPIYGASGLIKHVAFYRQDQEYLAVVKDGAGIGRTTLLPAYSSVISTMQSLLPKNNINTKYLYFAVSSMDLAKYYTGATIPHIYFREYKDEKLPLPPLDIQQKIAAVLEKASVLIELRKAQLEKLELLVKSQFIEMFGDPVSNPKGWNISDIDSICNVIVDCPHSTPNYLQENTGYLCIRTSVLKNNRIDWNRIEYISSEQFSERTKRYIPKQNDIVYSREGAILGIAAVIDRNINVALGQRMMLFSVNVQRCHYNYLWFVLNQNGVTHQVQDKIGGSASPHINVKDIRTFKIPVPPIELQNEFASFVKQVETQKKLFQHSLEKMELNYKSLMQKCFRGEIF